MAVKVKKEKMSVAKLVKKYIPIKPQYEYPERGTCPEFSDYRISASLAEKNKKTKLEIESIQYSKKSKRLLEDGTIKVYDEPLEYPIYFYKPQLPPESVQRCNVWAGFGGEDFHPENHSGFVAPILEKKRKEEKEKEEKERVKEKIKEETLKELRRLAECLAEIILQKEKEEREKEDLRLEEFLEEELEEEDMLGYLADIAFL